MFGWEIFGGDMLYRLIFMGLIVFINMMGLFVELKAYKLDQANILYTKIPYYLKDKKDFIDLVKEAEKSCKFFYLSITGLALIIANFFDPISIMLFDVIIISLLRPFFLQKDIDKIRAYKNTYGKEEERLKVIDLDLIEKREDFLVKKSYYLPVLILYLIGILIGSLLDKIYPNIMWIFLGLAFGGSDIFIDRLLSQRLVKTYTRDSSTNIRLNELIAKNQSKILYRKTVINGILFLIFVLITVKNPYSSLGFIIYMLALTINIFYSFIKFDKIRNHKDLKKEENNLLEDDTDYYTAWGYNNPDDKRLFVNKLYGMGSELNIGKLSGKIYYLTSILILVCLLIFISYISSTPTNYSYQVNKNEIEISSNMFYKDNIETKNIEKIRLLDQLPKGRMVRIAGNAMEKTSTGTYRIENYGKVRLYIYNDTDKLVEIKTKDKNFLVNENTEEKTEKLYQKLSNFVNKEKK